MNRPLTFPLSSRREWLRKTTCGMGLVALADLCHANTERPKSLLAPKRPHFEPKAKRLVFLHMRGGPSHMETFEYKPELYRRAGQEGNGKGKGKRRLVGNNWNWQKHGQSGLWISDMLPHIAKHADELCVLSGMHTDSGNHTPAMLQLHTGSFQFARPSLGSWVMYGLGTENANLPGFISLSPPLINGGSKNYGAAFLPAAFQGAAIGDIKTPIAKARIDHLKNPYLSRSEQRAQRDFIQRLNQRYSERDPSETDADGVIESFERGFSMQSELPEVMRLDDESKSTLEAYGIGAGRKSDNFGRQCLLTRRMLEAGVRHVEVCDEFWDQHGKLKAGHGARAAATDQPIAALISDLKLRGLLDDTLILWGGEFGRTPDTAKADLDGRDHNPKGYTMFLVGGGVKRGIQFGATDELGYQAVEGRMHLHDLHATILHLMGLDHEQLTYRYAGRDFRLTDVHGKVASEIIA